MGLVGGLHLVRFAWGGNDWVSGVGAAVGVNVRLASNRMKRFRSVTDRIGCKASATFPPAQSPMEYEQMDVRGWLRPGAYACVFICSGVYRQDLSCTCASVQCGVEAGLPLEALFVGWFWVTVGRIETDRAGVFPGLLQFINLTYGALIFRKTEGEIHGENAISQKVARLLNSVLTCSDCLNREPLSEDILGVTTQRDTSMWVSLPKDDTGSYYPKNTEECRMGNGGHGDEGGGESWRILRSLFSLYMAIFGQPTSVPVKWLPFTNQNSDEAQTGENAENAVDSGGDVFDLIGNVDPTDEDEDIGMGDSTGVSASLGGEIFSGGKKCREIKH
ncbi:hypothetical protein Tco_1102218 [Tanacetum coccineum]